MLARWVRRSRLVWLSAMLGVVAAPVAVAQEAAARDLALRTRLDTVLTAAAGTPDGAGLLPTAVAEAWVAVEAARAAANAPPTDLPALQQYARGVVHALDPLRVATGPGHGYGAQRAVSEARAAIVLAVAADALAPDVAAAAPPLEALAQQVDARLAALLVVADRVATAGTAVEAAADTAQLRALAEQVVFGVDLDGDGRITATPGEAGLVHWRVAVRRLLMPRARAAAAVRP